MPPVVGIIKTLKSELAQSRTSESRRMAFRADALEPASAEFTRLAPPGPELGCRDESTSKTKSSLLVFRVPGIPTCHVVPQYLRYSATYWGSAVPPLTSSADEIFRYVNSWMTPPSSFSARAAVARYLATDSEYCVPTPSCVIWLWTWLEVRLDFLYPASIVPTLRSRDEKVFTGAVCSLGVVVVGTGGDVCCWSR
jgi:hypothetical protein